MTQLIQLENAANVRELGGYKTTSGKTIKRKKLIRSAAINELSETDQATLSNYGINQIIDFRSYEEAKAQPDQPIRYAQQFFLPIFSDRHFVESPHARKQYRHFFDLVLENAEAGATLFHCTAGKDRTGFGAFLLLSLLEVDQSTIKQDYLATNRYLGPFLKEKFAPMAQQMPPEVLEAITTLMSAKESFLDESLAAIKKEFGTVDQYLKEGLAITNFTE